MLGFLGCVIGPVSGLLTYDDGQQIDNEINELNEVAANLSHLVVKQTHVVRAQFEEIHEEFGAYEERHKKLKYQLTEIQRGVYQVSSSLYKLNHPQVLTNMLHALKAGLDGHLQAADRLLEIVHAARRGLLHISLLTSEQMEPIYRDIQDVSPLVAFPISGPKVDIEDWARVETAMIIWKTRTLTVWLDIPLLNKADYTMYQLHPVPVTQ